MPGSLDIVGGFIPQVGSAPVEGERQLDSEIGQLGGLQVGHSQPDRNLGGLGRAPLRLEPEGPQQEEPPQLDKYDRPLSRVAREPLPTAQELIQEAGAPKSDTKIFGVTVSRNSTGYKKLLAQLNDYHNFVENPPPGISRSEHLRQAIQKLQTLDKTAEEYLRDGGHTRGESIRALRQQIRAEYSTARSIEKFALESQTWPAGMSLERALDLGRSGFSFRELMLLAPTKLTSEEAMQWKESGLLEHVRFFARSGATPEQAQTLLDAGFDPQDAGALLDSGCSVEVAIAFRTNGFTAKETSQLHQGGLRSAMSFRLQGISTEDSQKLVSAGISPSEANKFRSAGLTVDQTVAAKKAGLTPEKLGEFRLAGFSIDQAIDLAPTGLTGLEAQECISDGATVPVLKQFAENGLSPAEIKAAVKEYARLKIPFHPDTLVKDFRETNLSGPMKKLGNGAFNTVYKGTYKRKDGTETKGVFKEEPSVRSGWVSGMTGIQKDNPQYGMRNIASYKLAQRLGFDVMPPCEFGMQGGKLGIVMGLAPGSTLLTDKIFEAPSTSGLQHLTAHKNRIQNIPGYAESIAKAYGFKRVFVESGVVKVELSVGVERDSNEPSLQRELVKLQLVDALVAQGDRHCGNYLVERRDDGTYGVKGIDNDQSFGKSVLDPNGIAYGSSSSRKGFRGVQLPEVIDTEMRDSILSLTEEQIEEEVGHLITPEELQATKTRLQQMKLHVNRLTSEGKVIEPNQWGSYMTHNLLRSHNSYVQRDRRVLEQYETTGRVIPYEEAI